MSHNDLRTIIALSSEVPVMKATLMLKSRVEFLAQVLRIAERNSKFCIGEHTTKRIRGGAKLGHTFLPTNKVVFSLGRIYFDISDKFFVGSQPTITTKMKGNEQN
jgi:hypothetical protein